MFMAIELSQASNDHYACEGSICCFNDNRDNRDNFFMCRFCFPYHIKIVPIVSIVF